MNKFNINVTNVFKNDTKNLIISFTQKWIDFINRKLNG